MPRRPIVLCNVYTAFGDVLPDDSEQDHPQTAEQEAAELHWLIHGSYASLAGLL